LILSIFLVVIGLALALLVTGFMLDDTALQLVGFAFLFISGSLLLAGSIEYKSGFELTEYYVYGDNYSGYHWDYTNPPPNCNPSNLDCVKLFHTNQTTIFHYSTFNDTTSHFVGVFLMIVSILGSAVIFTRLKQEREDNY